MVFGDWLEPDMQALQSCLFLQQLQHFSSSFLSKLCIFHFLGYGTSNDPCDMLYAGRYPFSEPETYSLGRYLLSRRKELKVFLDVHTYGQLLMSPWGHTRIFSPHYRSEQVSCTGKLRTSVGKRKEKMK